MGIVALVQWMRKSGFSEQDWDFLDVDMLLPGDRELFEYFVEIAPDVIGLSAVTSGSYSQVKRIAAIAQRACPEALIVLGGNLAASANVVLRKTAVEVCVVGDGEIPWTTLLQTMLAHGRSEVRHHFGGIQGLAFLDENRLVFTGYGQKLSEEEMVYVPDYGILERGLRGYANLLNNYFRPGATCSWFSYDARSYESTRRRNIANVFTNKGCIARCTFCQRSSKGYRQVQIEALEQHVRVLIERYDVGFIHVGDENFGSDREHAFAFAALMKRYDLLWFASGVRCDTVTQESIEYFASQNCVALKFGVESGSQKILDLMEKKFKVAQVRQALSWCRKAHLYSPLAIMFGMPGETESTARETGHFLAEISLASGSDWESDPIDIFYAIPFPGTPLYEYGQQVGIIGTSVDEEEDFLANLNTAPSPKLAYVNLNGAPITEALTWDLLAQIEASRVFYDKRRGSQSGATHAVVEGPIQGAQSADAKKVRGDLARRLLRKTFSVLVWMRLLRSGYPILSQILHNKFVRSRLAARIPARILDPSIKFMVGAEYLVVNTIARARGTQNYRYLRTAGRVPRIDKDYATAFPLKRVPSIRTITIAKRAPELGREDESRVKLAGGY